MLGRWTYLAGAILFTITIVIWYILTLDKIEDRTIANKLVTEYVVEVADIAQDMDRLKDRLLDVELDTLELQLGKVEYYNSRGDRCIPGVFSAFNELREWTIVMPMRLCGPELYYQEYTGPDRFKDYPNYLSPEGVN